MRLTSWAAVRCTSIHLLRQDRWHTTSSRTARKVRNGQSMSDLAGDRQARGGKHDQTSKLPAGWMVGEAVQGTPACVQLRFEETIADTAHRIEEFCRWP